jgi:hypothetical protein
LTKDTLGYIDFDILCNLNYLEKKLSILPCFDHCLFYGIGKYNTHGKYMVRRVYIHSDLKLYLRVSQSDQQITCIESNHTISSFFAINIMLQVNFQEGEQILLPCILLGVSGLYLKELKKISLLNNNHSAKPRTVCSQEGKNDKDITYLDIATLETFDSKVKQFFVMIVFDTFDELMLRHDVCSLLFLEIHT